jgi:hypothetical protein
METLIARLLQDFEYGKLTRRQLIQSLALAAATTSAAGIASAADGKGFKAIGLSHISYQVADFKKTRDFYTRESKKGTAGGTTAASHERFVFFMTTSPSPIHSC